ncbi:glycosyltransferase family 2 protein [Rhizobium sp.]|uniref:glycosyltransferase family 2 protein n=1 Tax=Rhizobium sp. TaxID=391 RepID=UPI00289F92C2
MNVGNGLLSYISGGNPSGANLEGKIVCISFDNAHSAWPYGIRIAFDRRQSPARRIVLSPRARQNGSAHLFCRIPKGLISLKFVAADGNIYGGSDVSIGKIRRVSLGELVLRIGLRAPKKLLAICKLLAAGNRKGTAFRFARAVDDLNSLPYHYWLQIHESIISAGSKRKTTTDTKVFVTVGPGSPKHESNTIRSLERQRFTNWTIIKREALPTLDRLSPKNLWLSIPAGGVLADNAMQHLVQPFTSPHVAAVYSDEDEIGLCRRRQNPFFKPAWSKLLAQSGWLPLEGAVVRLSAIPRTINLTTASVTEAICAITPSANEQILHLPLVLQSMPKRNMKKHPILLECIKSPFPQPRVSVVIPTRDRLDFLAACIEGLCLRTSGVELDLIIIDNDSRDERTLQYFDETRRKETARVIPMPGDFNFSKACNLGVSVARHDLILLLNNDVDPIEPDWLVQMCRELEDSTVGAVGAYLLYPDGLVQHAGVTLGAGSVARHSFAFIDPEAGEDHGLLQQRRDVSAVTAACLLTTRSLWQSVGGMDEENLPVAFNDTDYCLKLRRMNKRVIWTPRAKLWHHESVSRGKDNTAAKLARFVAEETTMYSRWARHLRSDPFHNPNLSLVGDYFMLESAPENLSPRTSAWD